MYCQILNNEPGTHTCTCRFSCQYSAFNMLVIFFDSRFQISFDFRTFYENGSIFLLSNANYSEYIAAQILKGSVVVFWTNNGGKIKKYVSSKVVNSGQWHTAVVSKDRRRISLEVDGKTEMDKQRIPKKLSITSPMIVGSLVDDISINNDDLVSS